MKNAKFLSILSDSSTDSAIIEQEIVYMRYALKGTSHTHFLGLAAVEKANAAHIFQGINSTLDKVLAIEQTSSPAERLWREKLVALGTDGASVMLEKNNGMVAKFKTANGQHIIGVHCMDHRLELAFKDSTAKNTCHKKLEELLLGLYYFYHSSALNRANLQRSFGILALRPVMPTRVGGTRSIGHIRLAIDRFLKGYAAIIQHLKQIQSPDATGVKRGSAGKE